MITPKVAEDYAKKTFKNAPSNFEKKFLLIHTRGVLRTALKLSKNKDVDLRSITVACWLHDVGRTVDIANHAKVGVEMVENNLEPLNETVKDCILNHGTKKTPKTLEGKIVQLADKLSIMNDFELLEMLFSDPKNKEKGLFFLEMVEKDLLEVLKNYDW